MSTILNIYKSHLASVNVIMPNGKVLHFVNGVYRTSFPDEVAFLNAEVAARHPHIWIDPMEETVDSELVDPMAMLRHTIEQEILAKYNIVAGDPNRDLGTTPQNLPLNVTTTKDIADAAAGGSGLSMSARLMQLQTPNAAVLAVQPPAPNTK